MEKDKNYRHKDVTPSQKQYIRVGELPPDGKSKIRRRADNSIIGEEEGISVFEYIEGRGIVVPHNQQARDDFLMLFPVMLRTTLTIFFTIQQLIPYWNSIVCQ